MYRHRSPSHSRDHKTIPILALRTSTEVKVQTTWRRRSSLPTRPSSRIHRAVKCLPSSRLHRHRRQHQNHQELEEGEEYQGQVVEVVYQHVVVQREAPEEGVELQEGLLDEVAGHDHEKKQRAAVLIPTRTNACRLLLRPSNNSSKTLAPVSNLQARLRSPSPDCGPSRTAS
jgi:hypothetical protein